MNVNEIEGLIFADVQELSRLNIYCSDAMSWKKFDKKTPKQGGLPA